MAATQFAADTPLLVMGLIATGGIFSLWRLWIYGLAFLLLGFVLAGSWRRAGVLTDAELAELRYSSRPAVWLRGIKAVYFGTVFNCTVLAMVLLAATRIAEPFLLWDQWLPGWAFSPLVDFARWAGVSLTTHEGPPTWVLTARNGVSLAAVLLLTLFYSTAGGLRSVVKTDTAQFALMIAGTFGFAVCVVSGVGGLDALVSKLQTKLGESGGPGGMGYSELVAFTPSQAFDVSWPLLTVFALQWLIQINSDGTGYLAQRSMACRTAEDAKVAAIVFTSVQVVLRSLLWIPIGLGLMVLFPWDSATPLAELTANREFTYVLGMESLLPAGLKGLMLTGMLAALASTVDTHLNWGASYWTNDLYKRFVCEAWRKQNPSPSSLVWVARTSNVLILALSLVVMANLSSIQTAWQMSLMLGAGMGMVLILRWIWWRTNAAAEMAAIVASGVLAPFLFFGVESEALRLLLIALGSTAAAIAATFWAGPERWETLEKFFDRVHPKGFWGPVAERTGKRPREDEFWRGLGATLLCAFSLFSLLTGLGSLLFGAPPPVWFPFSTLWNWGLIVVAVALMPVWWRLGELSRPGGQRFT